MKRLSVLFLIGIALCMIPAVMGCSHHPKGTATWAPPGGAPLPVQAHPGLPSFAQPKTGGAADSSK